MLHLTPDELFDYRALHMRVDECIDTAQDRAHLAALQALIAARGEVARLREQVRSLLTQRDTDSVSVSTADNGIAEALQRQAWDEDRRDRRADD